MNKKEVRNKVQKEVKEYRESVYNRINTIKAVFPEKEYHTNNLEHALCRVQRYVSLNNVDEVNVTFYYGDVTIYLRSGGKK